MRDAGSGGQPGDRASRAERLADALRAAGGRLLGGSLVLILVWFGLLKFTAYEAEAIRPLVAHSPLMSWLYALVTPRALSAALGVVELAIAALIALRPLSATLAAAGSALAIGMFATTLSFLVTTPGIWEPSLGGFPAPGPAAAFLLKDMALLAGAVWCLGEALGAGPRTAVRPARI